MHFEYAAEYVMKLWESNGLSGTDTAILADIVEDQVLELALKAASESSNEKMVSIIDNMKEAQTQKYKKVTRKQELAVSTFLLETFGTVSAVLCKSFDKKNEELFGKIELTDDEAAVTQGHSVILTLGYVCIEEGDVLPVSKKLLENWLLADDRPNSHDVPVSVALNGVNVWVTYSEYKAHDLNEVDVKKGIYQ
ncbi:hypothetical protein [Enterovibrio norvegicus]|uniref:hypothetical protein n=1 Tax=Enterovibrio norvegicus TaxID=188144 RepID=UPI000C843E20|nr:hypothetical protein [Enterovibrio norvegicus]PMH64485.1 hypothetical protein BCU62_15635 [Enterovibrio norvegicus]